MDINYNIGIMMKTFQEDNLMNYFEKGNMFYKNENYKEALDMYKKSAKNNINKPSSLYNSSVCLIKIKNYEDAIYFLKSAIMLKPESKYFFNLAYCYSMLNISSKALLYFNTAWALNPEDKDCEKAINLITNSYKNNSVI